MYKPLFDCELIESAPLVEKGRTLNANNETLLRQAAQLLVRVINSIKAETAPPPAQDPAPTPATPTKEAGTFNQSDTMSLLQAALTATAGGNGYDTYIADVYEDQGYLIYRKGYNGGFQRADFAIDADGTVTLGTPSPVVRKVTYISPGATPATESRTQNDLTETALIEDTAPVHLLENTVATDGTVLLKLIAPGKGSSGYYLPETLKRDGPRVFKAGMMNLIDHPTPEEERARPEGSITRLGSTLIEDAHWRDSYVDPKTQKDAGPGLYARALVNPTFANALNVIGPSIGVSIRANGKARMGHVGDYKGPIIEAITAAKSADYVTMAGAGGKVLSLVESAHKAPIGENEMGLQEEMTALRETISGLTASIATMREATIRNDAQRIVESALAQPQYRTLPEPIRARVLNQLSAQAPLTEARDAIDVSAFGKQIEAAIKSELDYLTQISGPLGFGAITGFGSVDPLSESAATIDYEKELTTLFGDLGLSETAAKVAAAGR